MPTLPYWLSPGDDRPTPEIDDEIAEELRLHLDLMAEEHERRGADPGEAKRLAAERFGDFDQLLRRCRREKQGDAPMLKRMQAALIGLLAIVVGFVAWQQLALRETLSSLKHDLTAIRSSVDKEYGDQGAEASGGSFGDLPASVLERIELRVSDPSGEPIEGVRALFCYSIPSERNGASESSSVTCDLGTTNTNGRTEQKIGMLKRGDFQGVWIVCAAPGFALSVTNATIAHGQSNNYEISLQPTTPFRLRVTNADGEPTRRISVFPTRRTDLMDRTFEAPDSLIPQFASQAGLLGGYLRKQADDNGEIEIDWFAPRDLAQITLKQRGKSIKEAEKIEFEVPEDPSKVVVVKLHDSNVASYGGGRGYGSGHTVAIEEAATEELPQD